MRALDGTYWRVKHCYKGHTHTYNCYLRDDNGCSLVTFENHDAKPETIPKCSKLVHIRPRMSIVRAVRLLTEARKQGVELWMRFDFCWVKYCTRYGFVFRLETGTWNDYRIGECDIAAKWIVATPEDARRIDAKRGGK